MLSPTQIKILCSVGSIVAVILGVIVIAVLTSAKTTPLYVGNGTSLHSMCTVHTKRCSAPAGSHPCCVDKLAIMLADLSRELGPRIAIMCGTLLAFRRYRGHHMIPHDDDLDTMMLAEDEHLLIRCLPRLRALGYRVELCDVPDQGTGPDPSRAGSDATMVYPPARYYVVSFSARNDLHVDIALLTPAVMWDGTRVLVDAPQVWADTVSTMGPADLEAYRGWILGRRATLPFVPATYLGVATHVPVDVDGSLGAMYGPAFLVPYDRDATGRAPPAPEPVGRLIRSLSTLGAHRNTSVGLAPILIVNLPNDPERLHHLLGQVREEGLFGRVGGSCCVRALKHADNDRFTGLLVPGEKKCFLSHEACWRAAAGETLPSLILEDDASLPVGFAPLVERITRDLATAIASSTLPHAVCVRLARAKTNPNTRTRVPGTETLATSRFSTGTWAYILTPAAARILLRVASRGNIHWPTDHFLNPPAVRTETDIYDHRLPPQDVYASVDLMYEAFVDVSHRYTQYTDAGRDQIVQELSTASKTSRSSVLM